MQKEFENESIKISYTLTDESFDHHFGREKKIGYDIDSISCWIEAVEDWVDVSDITNKKIIDYAKKLIEKEIF